MLSTTTSRSGRHEAGRPLGAIILAAGQGTRMNSELPKVLQRVAGKPMLRWVIDAVIEAGADPIVAVIGRGAESVKNALADVRDRLQFVVQKEQLGTAHATQCAEPVMKEFAGDVLVLAGDGPLIRATTIRTMLRRHRESSAAATLATSVIDDPSGYGRVIRTPGGEFGAIVEHRHATPTQRAIREIYPSYACFDTALLFEMLDEVQPDPESGEYYVTEVFRLVKERGRHVEVVDAVPPEDVLSINTPAHLEQVEAILLRRVKEERGALNLEAAG